MSFSWFCFQFILVVLAKDENDNEVDPPMEIYVLVDDVNDNAPVCDEETVFEFQENEPVGKDDSVEVRSIHIGGGFFSHRLPVEFKNISNL